MSEELAQGPYVVARVGFEPATLRTQSTELTTEPLSPIHFCYKGLKMHKDTPKLNAKSPKTKSPKIVFCLPS